VVVITPDDDGRNAPLYQVRKEGEDSLFGFR
jgi:hypothetical protein